MASFTLEGRSPRTTAFKDKGSTQVELLPWQEPRLCQPTVEDVNYTQAELPEWQELTPWQIAFEDVIDQHGGPEAIPRMSFKTAKRVRKLVETFAPSDHPPEPLYSPVASEYGDTLTRDLFEEHSLSSGIHSDKPSQEKRSQCEGQAFRGQHPLPSPEALIDRSPYSPRIHFDEGESEGLYDYVYDHINLPPLWRHTKDSNPRPESVIGTKRGLDDDLPLSQKSKKRKTTADWDSIHSSLTADTPRLVAASQTAVGIAREVRKKKTPSLKGRKLQRLTPDEKLKTRDGAAQPSKMAIEEALAKSSDELELVPSAESSESDSREEQLTIDSTPTTPGDTPEVKDAVEIAQTYFTREQSPPGKLSQIMDGKQKSSTSEATATARDGPSPITVIHSEAGEQISQYSESSAGLRDALSPPHPTQGVIEDAHYQKHETKDAPEDTEIPEVPFTSPKKEQKTLESPRQGRKDKKKPLKPTSSKIEKPARMTRSKAKANTITKFEKLGNAGKLLVDWTT